jgi:hypothetical protein
MRLRPSTSEKTPAHGQAAFAPAVRPSCCAVRLVLRAKSGPDHGFGLRCPRQGMDHQAGVSQPPGGPSARKLDCALAQGCSRPSHRRAQAADLLRGRPEVLRLAGRALQPGEGDAHRQDRRRPRLRHRLHRFRRLDRPPGPEPKEPCPTCRPARPVRRRRQDAHCRDQANLYSLRRPTVW